MTKEELFITLKNEFKKIIEKNNLQSEKIKITSK